MKGLNGLKTKEFVTGIIAGVVEDPKLDLDPDIKQDIYLEALENYEVLASLHSKDIIENVRALIDFKISPEKFIFKKHHILPFKIETNIFDNMDYDSTKDLLPKAIEKLNNECKDILSIISSPGFRNSDFKNNSDIQNNDYISALSYIAEFVKQQNK
jgi:hypothetical protein